MTRAKTLLMENLQNISSTTSMIKQAVGVAAGTILSANSNQFVPAYGYVKISFDYEITCTQYTADTYPYIRVLTNSKLGGLELFKCSTSVSELTKTVTGRFSQTIGVTSDLAEAGQYILVVIASAAATYSVNITNLSLIRALDIPHIEATYLQGNGSQYINTGITGQSGIKVEAKIEITTTSQSNILFGSRATATTAQFCIAQLSATFRSDYGSVMINNIVTGIANNSIHTITKNNNLTYDNGTLVNNTTAAVFSSDCPVFIFCANTAGTTSPMSSFRLYYFKMWDTGGVLVRDFIPVNRVNVYCLYDKVSGTYFNNAGTGAFTGG